MNPMERQTGSGGQNSLSHDSDVHGPTHLPAGSPLAYERAGRLSAGDAHVLAPGMMVTPSIRLVRLLGEGGMGSVWIADHLVLDTRVAVKFMSEQLARVPEAVDRFEREAKSTARIRSPHVVQIFDYGTAPSGLPFIVMELLDGETLDSRIARTRTLSIDETRGVVVQVCKALSKAHAMGITHRDIKPENIFLLEDGGELLVKLLDFGIAKEHIEGGCQLTSTGATMGTPWYMSPEQVLNAKLVDSRTDLWALSVVAYHCLTGKVPFGGDSFGAICININRGVFTLPRVLRPDLPAGMDPWFTRALSRDVSLRFASSDEMADTLATVLRDLAAGAATIPPTSFSRRASSMAYDLPETSTSESGFEVAASERPTATYSRYKRRSHFGRNAVLSTAIAAAVATYGWTAYAPQSTVGTQVRRAVSLGQSSFEQLQREWRPQAQPAHPSAGELMVPLDRSSSASSVQNSSAAPALPGIPKVTVAAADTRAHDAVTADGGVALAPVGALCDGGACTPLAPAKLAGRTPTARPRPSVVQVPAWGTTPAATASPAEPPPEEDPFF